VNRSACDALTTASALVRWDGWSVLAVHGADRERFLHSQLTSDVRSLETGRAQPSSLLDGSGRLVAFLLLGRRDDELVAIVPCGARDGLVRSLESRIIADDVELRPVAEDGVWLALGPAAVAREGLVGRGETLAVSLLGSRGVVGWGEPPELPALDADDAEARRIVSGLPHWGVEVAAGQLVNETPLLDLAVSFTKGCFLGQETVAKLAAGRGAAYAAAALGIAADVDPDSLVGRSFRAGSRERAGGILSACRWKGAVVAWARIHRELRVEGRELELDLDDGVSMSAVVRRLPLLTSPEPAEMAEACYHEAVRLFTDDHEDEAVELLERTIAICPRHADAYESLGVILGRHRRFEEAIGLMQRLLEVDPGSVMAHTNMSVYYNQLGRIEDAEREARNAAIKSAQRQTNDREGSATVSRREVERMRELEERAEMFRQVLAIDPDDALGNFGLGDILVEMGRFGAAIPHLEKALEVDPDYSAAFLALGRALDGLGRPDEAREVLSRGVDVAAGRGDLMTANTMQELVARLPAPAPTGA